MDKLKDMIEQMFNQLEDIDDLDELNTTNSVAGYDTPNAFCTCTNNSGKKCSCKDNYKDSTLYIKMMNEVNYREFKRDDSLTTKQKINKEIKNINSSLFELNRIVKRCTKLKNETGSDETILWKTSKKKLHKIRERLLKISKNIMELGS
jgi:hypothetical protein